MGGSLIDILVIAIVAGFAWVGASLGLVRSSVRLVAAAGAVLLAALLRAPVGSVIDRISPIGDDLSNLLAMLAVGYGAYLAIAALATYYSHWVPHDDIAHLDRALGAVPGALVGIGWSALMVALVALLPSDNRATVATIESKSGGVMIEGVPGIPKWLRASFPRYTQTLPKGERGAETRASEEDLPLRLTDEPRDLREEAGTLLSNINQYRKSEGLSTLTWNLEVASAARRHSRAMLEDDFFAYAPPDGGLAFEDRMKSSLGTNVPRYDRFAEQIVWSHTVANAYAALVHDAEARDLLLDENLSEVGIGVADGGWFNGLMFTIGYLGRATESPAASTNTEAPTTSDPSSGDVQAIPAPAPPSDGNSDPADGAVAPSRGEDAPPGASGIVTD